LVKSIIQLSRPFKVAVVAEGVESLKHADILADMGCDLLQGFAFCKPIPAFGVIAMLSKNRTEFSSGNRKASRRRA
jgi:EAL domain-containing protein (putative c-di-GMP-specific phosphodiesterase class I)